ncbi:probable inactive patatin-like protein 9 [Amaranthus tricolor]|uniref:probable inactive patatin-like protein 9 n=1 Tax=Amaranthus tricolor TaxID=29722 RepID=UPI002585B242|nr:probable inactive patatin-like protein 9 [Amaranthus tricolor]
MEMELSKLTMEIFSKLEQQWLSNNNNNSMATNKKTRILSIDGGGTSAAVALTFLVHLEEAIHLKTGDHNLRIADFFDIVAGTGIGGLLAAFLTAADSSGRPLFTAKDAEKFLAGNFSAMFKQKRSGMFSRLKTSRCSGESFEKVLKAIFSKNDGRKSPMTLKDTCKPILIPCYDLNTSAPFVFSSAAASASKWSSLDFELWKVCRAAMATPSVFEPFKLTSIDGKTVCSGIDGGLVMNNPTAAAVTHVLHNKVDFPSVNGVEDLLVLSLGNGMSNNANKLNVSSKNVGCSTACVVDIAIDGVSETIDQMLGNAFCWNRNDYVRIQANGLGGSGSTTMEELLREKGVESLTFGGKRLVEETNGERIEAFVQRLVAASGKSSLPPSPYKSLSPMLDGR